MSCIYKYKVYCTTEALYRYIWDTTTPITCPYNATHSINSGSITKIAKVYKFYDTSVSNLNTDGHNFYRLETSGNSITVNMPSVATSIGRIMIFQRLTNNANQLSLIPNGSDKINGVASNYLLTGNKSSTSTTTAIVKLRAVTPDNWEVLADSNATGEDDGVLEPGMIKDTDDPGNSTHYIGWNNTTKQWENRAIALNEMSDVTLTAPANNQIIAYNGSIWVNELRNRVSTNTYSNVYSLSANNGDLASSTDIVGTYIYNSGWRSLKTNINILNPTTYNYASLINASISLDQGRNRYWYRWRARDHTAQVYGTNAIPSTATTGTNYQTNANTGSAAIYNNTNQTIVNGGTAATTYLDINASTTGSVTFKLGNPLGMENYSTTGLQEEYTGWSIFMVLKDIVRIGTFGRLFTIDSQLAPLHGGPAYTPEDWKRSDSLMLVHYLTTTKIDMTSNFSNQTLANSADSTGRTCVIGIRYNQVTREIHVNFCTYDHVVTSSMVHLVNATEYYENTNPDILQYIRFGSNPSNALENSRMKLYELIVVNHAVEDMQPIMLALNAEYGTS